MSRICFSSVSGYSFICHPADEQETSADDGGHSGHPSEPDGAKMVQIIGNSEEIKKAFRNQIPATCPKNTKTIPQWKKRLPHFKNLSLERNSLDFADHPNG